MKLSWLTSPVLPAILLLAGLGTILVRSFFLSPTSPPVSNGLTALAACLVWLVVTFYPVYFGLSFFIKPAFLQLSVTYLLVVLVIPGSFFLYHKATHHGNLMFTVPELIFAIPESLIARWSLKIAPQLPVDPLSDSLAVLTSPRGGYSALIDDVAPTHSGLMVAVCLQTAAAKNLFLRFYDLAANGEKSNIVQTIPASIGSFIRWKSYWQQLPNLQAQAAWRDHQTRRNEQAQKIQTIFNEFKSQDLTLMDSEILFLGHAHATDYFLLRHIDPPETGHQQLVARGRNHFSVELAMNPGPSFGFLSGDGNYLYARNEWGLNRYSAQTGQKDEHFKDPSHHVHRKPGEPFSMIYCVGFLAYAPGAFLAFYDAHGQDPQGRDSKHLRTMQYVHDQWKDVSSAFQLPWDQPHRCWPQHQALGDGKTIYYDSEKSGPPLIVDEQGNVDEQFITNLKANQHFSGYQNAWGNFHFVCVSPANKTLIFSDYQSLLITNFKGQQQGPIMSLSSFEKSTR